MTALETLVRSSAINQRTYTVVFDLIPASPIFFKRSAELGFAIA